MMPKPPVKPYTTKDLQLMYNVGRKTIYRWYQDVIDTAGKRAGRTFTPRQIEIFFDCWGHPQYASPEEALKALNKNNNA